MEVQFQCKYDDRLKWRNFVRFLQILAFLKQLHSMHTRQISVGNIQNKYGANFRGLKISQRVIFQRIKKVYNYYIIGDLVSELKNHFQ